MRRQVRSLLFCLVSSLATGCITANTVIHLEPDGSGTIEQTLAVKAEMAAQLATLAAGFGADTSKTDPKAAPPELFTEKEMREAATKYGEGVAFVSSHPIKTNELVGRQAIYSFADITKVHINQKPSTPKEAEPATAKKSADDVAFRFEKQPTGSSVLTVVFPEPDLPRKKPEDKKADDAPKKPDPQQLEMAKKMFDGLHIGINLDVGPRHIVKTNSPYVTGSQVTLLEMDFTELMKNDQLLSQVAEPESIEEAKKLLQGVKGFKVNLEKEVRVEFK